MNYPDSTVQILGSGVSSGNVFHPYHYYELYNHISGIEFTLGLNPLNGYASLTARISGVEAGAIGGFLSLTGGTMSGDISTYQSGRLNIGSVAVPFASIHADQITISGQEISPYAIANSLVTSLLTGGQITLNGSSGIDISAGNGRIVDSYTNPNNPVIKTVGWPTQTNITLSNISNTPRTFIAMTSSGTVFQKSTVDFTQAENRDYIILGRVAHPNGSGVGVVTHLNPGFDGLLTSVDFQEAIGPLNIYGNVFSPNTVAMKLEKSSGETFSLGSNFHNNKANPNILTNPQISGVSFQYRYRNDAIGTSFTTDALRTTVVPGLYDNGTGIPASITPAGRYTIQRIYYVFGSNRVILMYGQNIYKSIAEAEAALFSETFIADNDLAGVTLFRGWLIVRENATDLNDTDQAKIINAGLFGLASPAGATSATTDLQVAYNNSIDPEIITDISRDGLTVREGTGVGLNLYEGKSSDGTKVFNVSASGNLYAVNISGNSIYDNGNRVVTSVNSQSGPSIVLTTTNISEGLNKYFTDARAREATSGYYQPSGNYQLSGNYLVSGVSPLYVNGNAVSISLADTSTNGYISSTDWNTFNDKQPAGNYEKRNTHVITVAKDGSANFTSVSAAITAASALTPSATQPININVAPGTYVESALILPQWVTLVGQDMETVFLAPTPGLVGDFITLQANTNISFITLQGDDTVGSRGIVGGDTGLFIDLHKVYVKRFDTGIAIENVTANTEAYWYLEYVSVDAPFGIASTSCLNVDSDLGGTTYVQINATDLQTYSTTINPMDTIHLDGVDVDFIAQGIILNGDDSAAGNGILINNGAQAKIGNSYISNYANGLKNENIGAGVAISTVAFVVKSCAASINILNTSTTGSVFGAYDRSLATIPAGVVTLGMDLANPSTFQTGEFYTGPTVDTLTEISNIWRQGPTLGLMKGGTISQSGLFGFSVLSGFGYIDNGVLRKVQWNNLSSSINASDDKFAYIDSNGALGTSVSSIIGDNTKILLGKVYCNQDGTIFAGQFYTDAVHFGNKVDEYLRDVFGAIVADGLVISNTSGLKIGMTAGEYYYSSHKYDVTSKTSPYFAEIWQGTAGAWTGVYNLAGNVNNLYYNSGNALIPLTTGYYTKNSVWYAGDQDILIVQVGTSQYSGILDAENAVAPTAPGYLDYGLPHIADIITRQGNNTIIEITDTRPVPSYKAPSQTGGGANITTHNQLLGLTADDHVQYLKVDGTRAMGGALDMGSYAITNVSTINSINLASHAAQHLPNGTDALDTSWPPEVVRLNATGLIGTQNKLARADHSHMLSSGSLTQDGYISAGDWGRFNVKSNLSLNSGNLTSSTPALSITGGTNAIIGAGTSLSLQNATTSQSGLLTKEDWNLFNQFALQSGNYLPLTGGALSNTLRFTILSGNIVSGLYIVQSGNQVISSSINLGSGVGVFAQTVGNQLQFNSLSGISSIRTFINGNTLFISGITQTGVIPFITSAVAPLSVVNGLLTGLFASATNSGFLSNSDWNNFNNKTFYTALSGNLTSSTPGVTITGGTNAVIGTGATINIQQATANQSGLLASGDWSAFNAKINSGVNLGSGSGVFANFNGTNLQFKTLVSGNNINITSDANTITISSTATAGANNSFNAPLILNGTVVSGNFASSTESGFLKNTDWNTFNQFTLQSGNYLPLTGGNITGATRFTVLSGNIVSGLEIYQSGLMVVHSATNLGSGIGIFAQKPDGQLQFNSLSGIGGARTLVVGNTIFISGAAQTGVIPFITSAVAPLFVTNGLLTGNFASATDSGFLKTADWSSFNAKINSGVNLGAGTGVFADFNGTNLRFKSLVSGVGINIVSDANTITISSLGGADTTTASNLGTGSGLFAQEVGSDLQFKTLKSGMNVTFDVTANDITINANLPAGAGEPNTASNIDAGTSGLGWYNAKVGFDLQFKEIVPGYGIGLKDSTSGITVYSSLPIASGNTSGILSAADWTSFNDRVRKNLMTRYEVVPLAAATVTTLGGVAATVNATATQPAYTQKYGWSQNFATAATLGSFAGLAGGANMFARSSGIAGTGPFNQQGGFDAWFRISVPDTIYSGVTPMFSGTRIFIGLSDQAAINQTLNLDNIPGNYAGFQFCNASGIVTGLPVPRKETNWTFITKNNVTQTIITGLPFLPECVYDIHFETVAPDDNIAFEMWNLTSGYYHSGWVNTNLPLNNTAMKPFLGIASYAMAAKNLRYGTFLVESIR